MKTRRSRGPCCGACKAPVLRLSTRAGEVLDLEPTPSDLGSVAVVTAMSSPGADGACVQARFAARLDVEQVPPAAPRHLLHATQCPATARRDFHARMHQCGGRTCGRWIPRHRDFCQPHWDRISPALRADIRDFRAELARGNAMILHRHRRAVALAAAEIAAEDATTVPPQSSLLGGGATA